MTIETRFFEYPEEFDDYFQPTEENAKHYYNLQNQSWGIPRKDKEGVLSDPIKLYSMELDKYPSNYETVWPGLQYQAVQPNQDPYERIFPSLYQDTLGAEVKAAKGYFIIDLLRRGASRQEAYTRNKDKYPELLSPPLTTVADITTGGASVVTSWAGRVFYAGFGGQTTDGDIRSPNLANIVAFSSLIQNKKDFFKCYQDGDPTSRDNSDIVDTDGGFIKISGAENILSFAPLKDKLIVIASNGVWAISGGSDYGFTATNYKVDHLSSFSGVAKDSVVREGNRIFFWGKDGIFVVAKNQYGDVEVVNITEPTIQSLYQAIPYLSKQSAIGLYDSIEKTVRWIYKKNSAFSSESETYELVFHTLLNAFTHNKIANTQGNDTELYGMISSPDLQVDNFDENIIANGETVVVGSAEVVMAYSGRIEKEQSTRYLAVVKNEDGSYSFSFSFYKNSDFLDWGETDAYAYMVTGENIATDSSVSKQIPYLTMHFLRTEDAVDVDGVPTTPSSCLVSVNWDWAKNNKSKKFGTPFQTYRQRMAQFSETSYDNGLAVLTSKSKVRGSGKAFSMKIETEALKDCRVLGWSLNVEGNAIT